MNPFLTGIETEEGFEDYSIEWQEPVEQIWATPDVDLEEE